MSFTSYLAQLNGFFSGAKPQDPAADDASSDAATPSAGAFAGPGPALFGLAPYAPNARSAAPAPVRPASGAASIAPTLVFAAGSLLKFDLIWDASVSAAPLAFRSAVVAAARQLSSLFTNSETITVNIGWGEVGGSSLAGSGALGESLSFEQSQTYAAVVANLKKDAGWSKQQGEADATLGLYKPPTGAYAVNTAEMKAWGLASSGSDGSIGLASTTQLGTGFSWDFTRTGFGPNQYDAIGVAEHELSEVMGRSSEVGHGFGIGNYSPLDLFRYHASGVRDIKSDNGTAYFSDKGGADNLGVYNNVFTAGDLGDWTGTVKGDSFGDGYNGVASLISPRDMVEMAALGYHPTAAALKWMASVA